MLRTKCQVAEQWSPVPGSVKSRPPFSLNECVKVAYQLVVRRNRAGSSAPQAVLPIFARTSARITNLLFMGVSSAVSRALLGFVRVSYRNDCTRENGQVSVSGMQMGCIIGRFCAKGKPEV